MKPERTRPRHVSPAQAAEVHKWARDIRRMSNLFALAGGGLLVFQLATVEARQWLQVLVANPWTLLLFILAFMLRRAAFKIYRIQAGMPLSELSHFQAKRFRSKEPIPTIRKVAPLPTQALDVRDQLLASGTWEGKRRLSLDERSEIIRRHQRPALLLAMGLIANGLLLWILISSAKPVFVVWIGMWPAGFIIGLLIYRLQQIWARSVRVIAREDGSWTEFLFKKLWSSNGEPADWRMR